MLVAKTSLLVLPKALPAHKCKLWESLSVLLILQQTDKQPHLPALHMPSSIHPLKEWKEKIHFQKWQREKITYSYSHLYKILSTLTHKGRKITSKVKWFLWSSGGKKRSHFVYALTGNFKLETLDAEDLR